jgi:hypothetical protein
MCNPSRGVGWCESRVFGEDRICADQTSEAYHPQQRKTDPLRIGEIDVGAVVVQRVYETESVVWSGGMGIKVAERQKQVGYSAGNAKREDRRNNIVSN